jgi:hypothetical protein
MSYVRPDTDVLSADFISKSSTSCLDDVLAEASGAPAGAAADVVPGGGALASAADDVAPGAAAAVAATDDLAGVAARSATPAEKLARVGKIAGQVGDVASALTGGMQFVKGVTQLSGENGNLTRDLDEQIGGTKNLINGGVGYVGSVASLAGSTAASPLAAAWSLGTFAGEVGMEKAKEDDVVEVDGKGRRSGWSRRPTAQCLAECSG